MSFGNFGFGQTAATTAQPNFASAFGATSTATPAQPSFGAAIPTASVAPSTGGLNFGGQQTASFGASTFGAPTTAAASSGLSFGAPASSATTAGLNFGAPATSAAGLPNFGAAPASSAPSLFGGTATTAPATSAGFGFGGFGTAAASTATSQPSLGGGLFGATSSANTGSLFGAKQTFGTVATSAPAASSAAPTFTGLGGPAVTLASLSGGLGSDEQKQDKAVKDQELPQPILQSIEDFKAFVKQQKNISSDITRSTCRPSERVNDDVESIKQNLFSIRNGIQSYAAQAKKLKAESSRTLGHAEMAQQTQDIVPSMQDKHFAPDEYFIEVVNGIEEELKVISQEVDSVERVVQSANESSSLRKEELVQAVRRLHEIFITVASKLQQEHNSVEQKKEQYLMLRQQYLHDTTDVFQTLQKSKKSSSIESHGLQTGPTLFGNAQNSSKFVAQAAAPVRPTFAPSLNFGTGQNPTPAAESTTFQLQQPPLGNKRGKH
ncbi:Hypothetical predicted protein [Cloeon dipterum]|uniref:Nucleoporin Nup54 alpha-helical domain-containing protein n=1 Tax=Cloeon dipterum TaxID=197152 RepID=A0A8S1CMK9_9INSE|nr:Hypothetical predicted protein [Cloeon dipterum]